MPDSLVEWTNNSTLIAKFETEVEYVHNLKELYKRIHIWLNEEGFIDFNGQDNYETLYWQTDQPGDTAFHHIWWRAYKHPGMEGRPHKQFTWFIKFNYQTVAARKAEIMHKGKKWKLHQSNTILRYEGHLIHDYEKSFKKSGLLGGMVGRWKNWMYRDRVNLFEEQLMNKMTDLHNAIKAFLELQQDAEQPPSVYPPSALP